MTQGKRDRLSAEQRTDMWRRRKAGESLHEIGRAFGKDHGSIQFLLSQRGGIVPAARRSSLRTFTVAEREERQNRDARERVHRLSYMDRHPELLGQDRALSLAASIRACSH
jgi:hypothetical protein